MSVIAGTKQTSGYGTRVAGVGLAIPLFDRRGGAREAARAEAALAAAAARSAELGAAAEREGALRAYRVTAAIARELVVRLVTGGDDAVSIATAAFREGAVPIVDVLDARRARGDALSAAFRALAEARLALLDLNRATGAPTLAGFPD